MKYAFAFLAALLIIGTSALPLEVNDNDEFNALDRDIQDFYSLLSVDELHKILLDHADDPELHKALKYLLSDDFHKLVYAVEDLPEFQEYVLYLQAAGYNIIRNLRLAHESLGMKDYVPPKPSNDDETYVAELKKGGGFDGYIDDLVAILPREEIKKLHEKKLKESPAFAKYKAALYSPEFAEISVALYTQKACRDLLHEGKVNGFNFLKVYSFQYQLLGFY